MRNLVIYGAGGFGREVASRIKKINNDSELPIWNFLGFFDDGLDKGSQNEYGSVLGGINECNEWKETLNVVIAIGNPVTIQKVVQKIYNPNIIFPNLMDNTRVADTMNYKIGKGNIILDSYLSIHVQLGDFNVMNGDVVIGHDVKVGSYNVFMPAVHISGQVTIGESNLFGVSSCVIQQIKIGDKVHIAPGSALMTRPKDDSLYIGVPAKHFKF